MLVGERNVVFSAIDAMTDRSVSLGRGYHLHELDSANGDDQYSPEETERRSDATLKRLIATPPPA